MDGEHRVAEWRVSENDLVKCSWIGENYIVLGTAAKKVICLQYLEHSQSTAFANLEEKIIQANIMSVMEYKDTVVIASDDRSLSFYSVRNNRLEDYHHYVIDFIPTFLYSFTTHPKEERNLGEVTTSNDDVIIIGCEGGYLLYYSFINKIDGYQCVISRQLSQTQLSMSAFCLHGESMLMVSSSNKYYLIKRSNPFKVYPVFFQKGEAEKSRESYINLFHNKRIGNICTIRSGGKTNIAMWYETKFIFVHLATDVNTSIAFRSKYLGCTGKQLLQLPGNKVLVLANNINRQGQPLNYLRVFELDHLEGIKEDLLPMICLEDEVITACCVIQRSEDDRICDWLVTASMTVNPRRMNSQAGQYTLRLGGHNFTSQISMLNE